MQEGAQKKDTGSRLIAGLTETVDERHEKNRSLIDEFLKNGGKVGGNFANSPMMLLTHTGAKSGEKRIAPLLYMDDGTRYIIFAAFRGSPKNPDWVYNLMANPSASVEVGTETFEVTAKLLTGNEREEIWTAWKKLRPSYVDMENKANRVIPVFALERKR